VIYSLTKAAKILERTTSHIRWLVKKGKIEAEKEPGSNRYKIKLNPELIEKYRKGGVELPKDENLSEAQSNYMRKRFQAVEFLNAGITPVEVAKRIAISHKTIYNWINKGLIEKYQRQGYKGLLNKKSAYLGKFRSLTNEQIDIIKGFRHEYPRATEAALYRRIRGHFEAFGWHLPCYKTIKKVFAEIPHSQRILTKEGDFGYESKVVHRQRRTPEAFPNKQWEADEIVLDVLVKDNNGKELTPRMILIVDSCTRGIPGYALGLTADSRLLDKAYYNAILKEQNKPFCGIPERILIDNGKIFVSQHMEKIWSSLGTEYIPMKVRHPWSKGVVERLARTLQENCLPFLEGYKGNRVSNRPPKEQIKPISMEALKSELDKTIAEYHNRKHSTLNMTPIARLQKAVNEGWRAKVPREKELELLLLYETKRTVSKEGIRIFNKYYWHNKFYSLLKQRVTVKYNPDDLQRIMIFHKDEFYCFAELESYLESEINLDIVKERQKEAKEIKRAEKRLIRAQIKQKKEFQQKVEKFQKEETFQIIEPEAIPALTEAAKHLKKIEAEQKKAEEISSLNEKPKKRKIAIYPFELEELKKGG
jgi:transposase InsO family protein